MAHSACRGGEETRRPTGCSAEAVGSDGTAFAVLPPAMLEARVSANRAPWVQPITSPFLSCGHSPAGMVAVRHAFATRGWIRTVRKTTPSQVCSQPFGASLGQRAVRSVGH